MYETQGGRVVAIETYPDDLRDFRTLLLRIREASPEAVLFIGYKEMGTAVAQARVEGLQQPFLSTAIFEDPEILGAAGVAAEGLVFTSITFDPTNPAPRAKAFVQHYTRATGRTPDGYAASAYDAVYILAEAVRKAGTMDPTAVRDALYALPDFEGLIGKIKFDKNGDAMLPIKLKRVEKGTFKPFIP